MTVENSSKGEISENAFKEDTAIKTINTVHQSVDGMKNIQKPVSR